MSKHHADVTLTRGGKVSIHLVVETRFFCETW